MIKKYFGQNFISDKNLILKIISILDNNNDLIIEIGPGRGALTQFLVKKFSEVTAIEIDTDLEDYIGKLRDEGLNIIYDDFMNINIESIAKNKCVSFISNTPYYLTSQIIFRIFELSEIIKINKAVLMVQKEVGERIVANVSENKYNNLSIACHLYAKTKMEFNVSKKMFHPMPKIDSSIISFDFRNNKYVGLDRKKIIEMVRLLFNNKRKTILNNLKNLSIDFDRSKLLDELNINPQLRPSDITIDQFIKIYKNIYGDKNV